MVFRQDVHARKAAKLHHAPAAKPMCNAQPDVMLARSAITGVSIEHGSRIALYCVVKVTCLYSRVPTLVCCCLAVLILAFLSFFELMCHIEA